MRCRFAVVLLALAVGCASHRPTEPSPPPPPPPPTASNQPAPAAEPADEGPGAVPGAIAAALAAPDRSEADRALDAGRKSDHVLTFFGIAPGMKVAELAAGGGYTAELLARVVGPGGTVYGQNNQFILKRFAETPWSERLKLPIMKNVVRVDREFDDPLPAEARELDAVLCILFYHDTVWMETDRDRMNRAVFAALKPGGVFGIVDHAARAGAGLQDVKSLHRIEASAVIADITRAGFVLDAQSDLLENPEDRHDWNASPSSAADRRGTSDRFVLRFKKP